MRRRLNLVAAAVTAMVAIAFLVPLLGLVADVARDRALNAAEQDAQLVSQLITSSADVRDPIETLQVIAPSAVLNGRTISVSTSDGRTAGAAIPEGESLAAAFAGSASNAPVVGGRAVLVPALTTSGETAVVRIFVGDDEMTAGVGTARIVLVTLSIALVAIAVLVTDALARSVVRPVRDLSSASAELATGNLETRVDPAGPPEISEVGRQFNRLADEIASLLQAEREAAADLSHRLRTPLTAARLDAEAIPDAATRETIMADLDNIERSVDHAIGILRAPGRAVSAVSDLEPTVRARFDFWEPLATEQGRRAEARIPDGTSQVGLAEDDLVAAVDALVGNIFSHTAEGVGYRVSVHRSAGSVVVAVDDAGPGFEDRGLASRGASAAGSTGLGLDIARRIAELAGGTMILGESDLGGASVRLTLPIRTQQ